MARALPLSGPVADPVAVEVLDAALVPRGFEPHGTVASVDESAGTTVVHLPNAADPAAPGAYVAVATVRLRAVPAAAPAGHLPTAFGARP